MIKANELRIGNILTDEWFDTFKKFIVVEDINDKGINLTITDDGNWSELARHFITPEYEFNQLRGIPLTEEWLIKFGFKSQSTVFEDYEIETFSIEGLNLVIGFSSTGSKIAKLNDEEILFPENVHQLQNLYFALKYEELTIKTI